MNIFESFIAFSKKHVKSYLVVMDIVAMAVACCAVALLKFDAPSMFKDWFDDNVFFIMAVDLVATMVMFLVFKIYSRMWQYIVVNDFVQMAKAFTVSKIITVIPFYYIWLIPAAGQNRNTRSFFTWIFLYSAFVFLFMVCSRISVWFVYNNWRKYLISKNGGFDGHKKKIMIIGAGGAARRLIEELRGFKYERKYNIIVLIDDNK